MIRTLAVRGAPAIGIGGAYGMVIAAEAWNPTLGNFENLWRKWKKRLLQRYTAVNLFLGFGANEKCLAGKRREPMILNLC